MKGQYGYCQNNNHRETTFNPWSEDLQPTESFMRLVREMQIRPDRYYLEMTMHQTLGKNYGYSNYMPNVWIYGQLPPRDSNDENLQIQSPCPSNWSDDLQIIENNNDESKEQREQPANQIITLTGTRVPQDILMDNSTSLRLLQTMPQVLKHRNKMANPTKDQTALHDLDMEKATKTRWPGTEIRTMGERKWKSIFLYRCGDLD